MKIRREPDYACKKVLYFDRKMCAIRVRKIKLRGRNAFNNPNFMQTSRIQLFLHNKTTDECGSRHLVQKLLNHVGTEIILKNRRVYVVLAQKIENIASDACTPLLKNKRNGVQFLDGQGANFPQCALGGGHKKQVFVKKRYCPALLFFRHVTYDDSQIQFLLEKFLQKRVLCPQFYPNLEIRIGCLYVGDQIRDEIVARQMMRTKPYFDFNRLHQFLNITFNVIKMSEKRFNGSIKPLPTFSESKLVRTPFKNWKTEPAFQFFYLHCHGRR